MPCIAKITDGQLVNIIATLEWQNKGRLDGKKWCSGTDGQQEEEVDGSN